MENEEDIDIDKLEEMILEEGRKSHKKTALLCPVCNSSNVWMGGHFSLPGQGYVLCVIPVMLHIISVGKLVTCTSARTVGYIGALVIEK